MSALASPVSAPTPETSVSPAKPDPGPPPTDADELTTLDVPGFLPAIVSLPRDQGSRPVLVATHGAGGAPEGYCRRLGEILDHSAFVLCPRGRAVNRSEPAESGFYYPDHLALEREVGAALGALTTRFGARADVRGFVYFGFSQGAAMGAVVLARLGARAAILVEGGYDAWNVAGARHFHEAGGERVLFACGRPGCSRSARTSAVYLERAGVATRVIAADGAGHTFGGAVERGVLAELPWLLGDDRFRLSPGPSDR